VDAETQKEMDDIVAVWKRRPVHLTWQSSFTANPEKEFGSAIPTEDIQFFNAAAGRPRHDNRQQKPPAGHSLLKAHATSARGPVASSICSPCRR